MTRGGRALIICLAGGVLTTGTAVQANTADSSQNPYQGIVDRNVFALRPPPPPPDPAKNKPPPPKITLTGITTILGKKQALMKIAVPAHPPRPAHEDSYILTEGQRDGELEVLAIDVNAGTVKVNNHGAVQTLDFADNGVKLPKASSQPLARARGPGPGFVAPRVITHPPGRRLIPPRPIRTPGGQPPAFAGGATPQSAGNENPGPAGPGAPVSGMTVVPNGAVRAPSQLVPGVTAEQRAILIEAQKEKMREEGNPNFRIMPPTEFSPQ